MKEFKKITKVFILAMMVSLTILTAGGLSTRIVADSNILLGVLVSVVVTFIVVVAVSILLRVDRVNEWMDR